MKPPQPAPSAFLGGPAYHPPVTPPSRTEDARAAYVPRAVPALTVYADGLVNLNTEASALLAGEGLCLHRPDKARAGRQSGPWHISPGTCHRLLAVCATKPAGSRRLKADPGALPAPGRYVLSPLVGQAHRFALVAVG